MPMIRWGSKLWIALSSCSLLTPLATAKFWASTSNAWNSRV